MDRYCSFLPVRIGEGLSSVGLLSTSVVCLGRTCSFYDLGRTTVVLSDWSRVVVLLVSGGDVSGSMPDSITYTLFGFDFDLVNRPSDPLGPVPLLLLQS